MILQLLTDNITFKQQDGWIYILELKIPDPGLHLLKIEYGII